MIRQKGYVPFARPVGKFDEMVIATAAESALQRLENILPGSRIALTDNKDVKLIGLRLLEPADLTQDLIEWVQVDSFQEAARLTIKGEVQAGFFLAESYGSLTRMTRSHLRVLVESRISDISHVVLAHPRMAGARRPGRPVQLFRHATRGVQTHCPASGQKPSFCACGPLVRGTNRPAAFAGHQPAGHAVERAGPSFRTSPPARDAAVRRIRACWPDRR